MKHIIPSRGITLLLAVLIVGSAIFLASNIAFLTIGQLKISQSARDSHRAFFSADAGLECARLYFARRDTVDATESFWDSADPCNDANTDNECAGTPSTVCACNGDAGAPTIDPVTGNPADIACAGVPIDVELVDYTEVDVSPDPFCFTPNYHDAKYRFRIDTPEVCAFVEVESTVPYLSADSCNIDAEAPQIIITSDGRSSCSGGSNVVSRVLRGVECAVGADDTLCQPE
ncbi:MAG: pilus assembly PilX N-terminal domain-containing protein [Patescibacteria group bacterium]